MKLLQKLKLIFPRKQRAAFLLVFVLSLIGTVLDFFGVSLVLPLINLLVEPDRILHANWYRTLDGIFHFPTLRSAMLFMVAVIILIYVVKNLYGVFLNIFQTSFVIRNRVDTSSKLLNCYMRKPYTFHLQHNSAEVIRGINNDTANTFTLVFSLIRLTTSVLLTVFLVVFLLHVDYVFTLAVVTGLLICSAVYFLLVRRKVRALGNESRQLTSEMLKSAYQAVHSIKAVKVMGREQYFVDSYQASGKKVVKNEVKSRTYSGLPNRLIEILCVGGLLAVVAFRIARGGELTSLIPSLSAFALAAIKLLPNASIINGAINGITYNLPSLDALCETIDENYFIPGPEAALPGEAQRQAPQDITVEHISFTYPGGEAPVLQNVDLTVRHGSSVGIVGTTGAGKTTLVDLILGLLEPQEGTIRYGGRDIREDLGAWQRRIGYIPQEIYLTDDTIRANVALGVRREDVEEDKVWHCLEQAQLSEFVRGLKDGLDTVTGERGVRLSGGQRQRIGIARALYHDPDILFFDEATSSLDVATEAAVMDSIHQLSREKTTIIVAHRLSTIAQCDHVYRVENGKILEARLPLGREKEQ